MFINHLSDLMCEHVYKHIMSVRVGEIELYDRGLFLQMYNIY